MFDQLPPNQEYSRKKVLVADDDNSVRRFIEIVLQREGHDVHAVEDGLEALKSATLTKFDLVVADAMMPNLTGYDLVRILRQNDSYRNVPMILLSGFELKGELEFANAYLLKGNDLKETLTSTLSKFILSQELEIKQSG